MTMKAHQLGFGTLGRACGPRPACICPRYELTSPLLLQGAMAATYSALNSSKPTPQLKPIESSVLAQRRVRKLPSTTL